MKALLVCLALAGVFCVVAWGEALAPHPFPDRAEVPEFAPAVQSSEFAYRHFLVSMAGKPIAHVIGTHYVMQCGGTGLAIKDAALDVIVYQHADSPDLTIGEERP